MRRLSFIRTAIHVAWFIILPAASMSAQAHLKLDDPVARTDDLELIEGPCGGIPAADSVATYTAGTEIEVTVNLFVRHVETLQINISYDNFATSTELTSVETPGSRLYKIDVPLPADQTGPAILQATDGTYFSCADITLAEPGAFKINSGLNDAWFFPGTNGQGFFIIVYPDTNLVFLSWFTYDTERPPEDVTAILGEPGHRWITAQGPINGDTTELNVHLSSGGVFDSPEPAVGPAEKIGTMVVVWSNCEEGLVSYDIPSLGLVGEVPIQRLANDNVALCEALIME